MAMPQPQSPHRSPVDVSSGAGTSFASKGTFGSPGSFLSSTSPKPTQPPSSTMSPSSDSDARDQAHSHPSLTSLSDPRLVWAPAYEMNASQLNQNAPYGSSCSVLVAFMGGNGMGYSSLNSHPYVSNYTLTYPSYGPDPSCPRSYTHGLGLPTQMSKANATEAHPPSAYVIEPPKPQDAMDLSESISCDQPFHYKTEEDVGKEYNTHLKAEESGYDSPYVSAPGTRSSTPHDGLSGMMRRPRDLEVPIKDEGPIDKEQPYAQLIYKALLGAPNHTMILRDIYNWFKENTDKAADKETKGWQNSIRHNLSMNGAFEKVDQPCKDSRKGFMWRLTDKAILEGVKSTTRYRSKQPNKRGQRSAHPLPQRQASGSKGGHASKRSAARLRHSQRSHNAYGGYRSTPYMCSRSVPANYEEPILETYAVDIAYPHPSSPYTLSDNGGFIPSLDHIDELGSEGPNFTGSPLISQDAMTQFGSNAFNGLSAFDLQHQVHGFPYAQPYDDQAPVSAYTFPKGHPKSLLYATDDTLSRSSSSPSASEPTTPEMQAVDSYHSESYDIDMGEVGPNGFVFQETGTQYAG